MSATPRQQPPAQDRPSEAEEVQGYEIGYFHIDIAKLRYDGGKGVQFVDRYQEVSQTWIGHIFGRTCQNNGIEHRLTKPYHPWTNGQAEQMVRTIKEATVNPSITPRSPNCDDMSRTG